MVHFVGAGPGAPDLITRRGAALLQTADCIIYAGSLVNPALLGLAKADCAIYNSAEMTLEQVLSVMEENETAHKTTVRLHTGDPCLYGAIREQMDALDAAGIPYDDTPGVSSFCGAAAALNAEYTLPGVSQTVIITRMEGRTPVPEGERLAALAAHGATMVIFLSIGLVEKVQAALLQGAYTVQTPAAVVYNIGTDAIPANCYCITFKEEQAGYMAGYAVVKDGKTKLGFLGGMAVPAVIRYGYGYVQGADAAAQELGTNIDINYFYGGQFYGDANITSRMEGWYSNGTQVVFACGGGIYTSAVEAALKSNGYVIGVDVDQNYIGVNGVADGSFAYNPFITSAMKGLTEAVNTALSDIDAGDWGDIAASNGNFGLEDGDYVGLPTDADSWNFETFTTDEYEALKEKIKSGEITVDNSSDDSTKPTVSEFTTVNYIQ